ncbi:unnamed protein product [Mytilus edulis]|uniref:Vwde helical domain-containing protein n=1 Tax=Mytilus edulis TaxID=6550 RepID=A0A8S3U8N8_MYTED|nr:unnamed protein product [Mytilus edulis]
MILLISGPCTNYDKIENQEKRSASYSLNFDTDTVISDDVLLETWYRIISRSGTDIPNEPPDTFRCGTWYPIWLNGTGGVQCPDGWSSINGYHPDCSNTGFPTEAIIPRVESTLDSGDPVNPSESRIPSLVVVFQCKFDEVLNYVYDVFWYINEHYVTEHNNILYSNIRQTDLRPEDWVGKHYMNMIVRCSVRIRNEAESLPGPYFESDWFKAGIYVNALFTKCGTASCNCGVAIQAGQSLFVVRICKNISKKVKYVRGLSTPFVDKRICDDKSMIIEENAASGVYDVTLSIGTTVSFRVSGDYISYITVKPSVLDLGSAEGLCGYISNENGKTDDDLRKRNETVTTTIIEDFAKSWEVTGTSESLFAENPPVLSYQNSLQSYCTCANEGGPHGGITDNNFLHCNLSQPMEACYDVQTDFSLDTRCSDGNRNKRSAGDPLQRVIRSTDDTDDVIEFTPLTISEDVFDDSVPLELFRIDKVPKWSNRWTYELAVSSCREYLTERFPPDLSDITGEYPDDYIETCVDDIKAAGDTSFMSTTLATMLTSAKSELERNQTLKEETTEDGKTVLEKLTSLLCLNNCSSNGNCINGACVCNTMFGGEDCSRSRTTAPTNISVPELGLCQSRARSCRKTNIMGHFMPPDVWCNIQHFEILENNRSYTGPPTISKAVIKHSYMVSCEFANARRKRSTSDATVFADGYEISVSNDGSNYGEVVTLIVFDEECYSCNTVNVTCTAIETCPLTRTEQTESGKVQNEENDNNNVVLPVSIITGLIVLAALIGFIVYQIKHKDIGHRQINTLAKEKQPEDLLSYDFPTQNIPPKLNKLDRIQTLVPRLTKEYSSASSFSVEISSAERRTPDHLFRVENKYN